jgi:hypothetical protein
MWFAISLTPVNNTLHNATTQRATQTGITDENKIYKKGCATVYCGIGWKLVEF